MSEPQTCPPPAAASHDPAAALSPAFSIVPSGAVLARYLVDPADTVLIQGPRGSGKSTASVHKLLLNAARQPPGPDGIARRRSYVVRNTFDELKRTTVQTWLAVLAEPHHGTMKWDKPFEYRIRIGPLRWDIVFLALDREEDAKKLLSSEISDIWFNEFREIPRRIIDDASAIVGRFPPKKDGGCFRAQIIGDTNPARIDHWFTVMSGQAPLPDNLTEEQRRAMQRPEGWSIHRQPPAMIEETGADGQVRRYRANQEAENRRWLPDGYYERLLQGKSRAWIRVNLLNKPALLAAGKPVWPGFREEHHMAREALTAMAGHPLFVGIDFGRTPAAVMGQRIFDRWRILGELTAEDVGAKTFAGLLKRFLAERFPGLDCRLFGDPAGQNLAEADDISPFLMFRAAGLAIRPAPSNDPVIRIGAVEELLAAAPEGRPRLTLSPACVRLAAALAGDYQYKRIQGAGERFDEVPFKNAASHIADALQYMALGAGEGRQLLAPIDPERPKIMQPKIERGWSRLRSFDR